MSILLGEVHFTIWLAQFHITFICNIEMVSVYVNPNNDEFIVIGRLAGNVKIHKIAPYHDSLAVLL